ncbi:MAG: helix-turn-helix transcriptional regulator [Olsenella sp.]|nr:helix-turn-helix transcriptional regulator [Olsenella sp.]
MVATGPVARVRHNIGKRIRELRRLRGLSQASLAGMTSLSRSYLVRVEQGESNFTIDSLIRISEGLDVPLSGMLEGVDVDPRQPEQDRAAGKCRSSVVRQKASCNWNLGGSI